VIIVNKAITYQE